MKQTAVEWFWLNLTDDLIGDLAPEKILKIHELKEQAKAMEKEQREKDFIQGYKKRAEIGNYIFDKTSEESAKVLFIETLKSE